MNENFETAVKSMEPIVIFELFLSNDNVRELFKSNVSMVREHISDIIGQSSDFERKFSLANHELYEEIRKYLSKNISKCYNIFRYYSVFSEIINYSEDKRHNLGVTDVDISAALREVASRSNTVLEKTDVQVTISEEFQDEVIMPVNRERFINFVLTVFQLCFAEYKNVRDIKIELEQEDDSGFNMTLNVALSDTVKLNKKPEAQICSLAIEFFLKSYNCTFKDELNDGIKSYTLNYKRGIISQPPNLRVASPSNAVKDVFFDNPFSNFRTALSGVSMYDFFN